MKNKETYFGELLGTFILTFVGCGAVALAVLYGVLPNLFSVAVVWGVGVALAILVSQRYSPAHLNPAVTLAMCVSRKESWSNFIPFIVFQFLGAFFAAILLYVLITADLAQFESNTFLLRGTPDSIRSAMIFGEFFPNPSFADTLTVTLPMAIWAESFGTFMLVFLIYGITSMQIKKEAMALLIGAVVSVLIILLAPYTQAGLNPARDFAPRLFSFLAGWGDIVFQSNSGSMLVYVIGPLIGGVSAALINKQFLITKRKVIQRKEKKEMG